MNEAPAYCHGVASPEQVARLTGKEILQAIIEGRLPHPPISQVLTFWLVEIGNGFAAFEGEPGDHLLNPMGTVHGGWAMTLIDSATGCAGYSLIPAGAAFRTVETKVNLSRPITSDTGRVRAEAHVVSQIRQIISAEAGHGAGWADPRARHVDFDGRLRSKMSPSIDQRRVLAWVKLTLAQCAAQPHLRLFRGGDLVADAFPGRFPANCANDDSTSSSLSVSRLSNSSY